MAIIPCRHHDTVGTNGLHRQRINDKGILGIDRRAVMIKKSLSQQHQDIVRAIANGQLFRRHRQFFRQRLLERKAAAVRVTSQFSQSVCHRFHRRRRWTQGVFITGQFDNIVNRQTLLTGQLCH